MKKKFYAQCGDHKQVLMAEDFEEAAEMLLKVLLTRAALGKISFVNEERNINLGILVIISEYGFFEDIMQIQNEEQLKKIAVIPTSNIFNEAGQFGMAKLMIKIEEQELYCHIDKAYMAYIEENIESA